VPLAVAGLYYASDITVGSPAYTSVSLGANLSLSTDPNPALDLYISHGVGRTVSLTSFMESFSLSSENGVFDIQIQDVARTPLVPPPQAPPGAGETVLRARFRVTTAAVTPLDLATIELSQALVDDRDNTLETAFQTQVNGQ
jgi:hypothetical protein